KDYDVERVKILSQWHHVAILDLTTTKNFRFNIQWISERLGISAFEARDAVERLLELGLLEKKQNKLQKAESQIYFVTQKSEPAVRSFHKQMISKSILELDKTSDKDFEKREISSITMAVRSDRISEARKRIQSFQKDLAAFLTEGDCDELFQLNLQLFQLSKSVKETL
ncbi:MAG: TIGR02147 family protein, partial [Pseudobdellovibrionaceae bacterium]